MDEEIIDAIADVLSTEMNLAQDYDVAMAAINNTIISLGEIINSFQPTYDMRYFYKRSGMTEPYPNHPIRR